MPNAPSGPAIGSRGWHRLCLSSFSRRLAVLAFVALVRLLFIVDVSPGAQARPGFAVGNHSMLYLDTPPATIDRVFALTRQAGMRDLRMDFALLHVFAGGVEHPDFRRVDAVRMLVAKHGVNVLGTIYGTPGIYADCPAGADPSRVYRCPPRDLKVWERMVARLVARAPEIRHWEALNEADLNGTFFYGDARAYARLLVATYRGVRAGNPSARLLISGPSRLDRGWIAEVLRRARVEGRPAFDVANVHLRAPLDRLGPLTCATRAAFARGGFRGALWVTETGYPSDPAFQREPGYRDGAVAQARWTVRAARAFSRAGAAKVFVAGRDTGEFGGGSSFSSEGFLTWPAANPKPAYWALKAALAAAARLPRTQPRPRRCRALEAV